MAEDYIPGSFVDFLVDQCLLLPDEAADLRENAALKSGRLGQMLLRQRVVNMRQMVEVLVTQAHHTGDKPRVGDLVVSMGFASRERVEAVASRQGDRRDDVYTLLQQADHLIDRDALVEAVFAFLRRLDDAADVPRG